MRVYELAKQMGISSTELMGRLQELGVEVKNHFETVDPAVVEKLEAAQTASSALGGEVKKEEQNEPQEEQSEPSEEQKPVSRADRLRLEKDKQRRKLILISSIASAVVVVLIASILLGGFFSGKPGSKKPGENPGKVAKKTAQKNASAKKPPFVIKPRINVLVVGIEEKDGYKRARGLLLAKLDFKNRTIQAVNIPETTYVHIPGLQFDQISESFTMVNGPNSTKKAVEGLLQVPIENHIVMHYDDFEYLVNEKRFIIAFDKAIETGFFAAEKEAYGKKIARISTDRVDIIPLPVKFVSINGEPYYEPNDDEVNDLLQALWGIKRETNTKTIRVIILNGSGLPGIGRDISQKLSPKGFMVSDIKNADNFNYQRTQIIAYKEGFREKAKEIKQILGVGDVLIQATAPDLAEIAIIVGKDYKVAK
jgi:hypothetical protein